LYPKTLPDLFHGSSITLLGRYRGSGMANISLKGLVRGKARTVTYDASFPATESKNPFIGALWAARRIGFLLDQIRLNGEDKELVDEITSLAKTYGIVTPYTSFLIVEDDDRLVRANRLRDEDRSLSRVLRAPAASQPAPRFFEEKRAEYHEAMKAKSGAPSARASEELQALNQSANVDQISQGKSRLDYKSADGVVRNVTQQVKYIQGRAFYGNGANWMDIEVQRQGQQAKKQRIKYGSAEFFDLLKKNPVSSQYLALGRNVSFVMDKQIYEIYE
jgi:Ca-activated chloride channel family protein